MSTDTEILTPQRVEEVFKACLFKDSEDATRHIVAEGITNIVGFHPDRIEEHRQEIHDMLAELPKDFKTSGGGGHSFLNACLDKRGKQWTSLHQTVDRLVQLGIAIDEVEYCLPRDMWDSLPGGMPYFTVKQ